MTNNIGMGRSDKVEERREVWGGVVTAAALVRAVYPGIIPKF